MTLLDLVIHFLNFLAPALFMALLMPTLARLLLRKKTSQRSWQVQVLIQFLAGAVVLVLGLWWLGRDGRMLTYAGLVLVAATTQWALL